MPTAQTLAAALRFGFAVAALLFAGLPTPVLAQSALAQGTTGVSRPGGGDPTQSSLSSGAQSAWIKGHQASARLIAGAEPEGAGGRRLVAGVELRLNEGWKTYWRHPGDDGGLPPTFDWTGSRNLKTARALYPVPQRLKSLTGYAIGYMTNVVFPIEIEPVDPALPVELSLNLEYGICREICVPAEAKIALTIVPTLAVMAPDLAKALTRVPVITAAPAQPGATASPRLAGASAILTGTAPAITFDIANGTAGSRADLFVEAPDGIYLPMTIKVGDPQAGVQKFRIDLKGVDDTARLAGKPLRLTITAAGSGTETLWTVR